MGFTDSRGSRSSRNGTQMLVPRALLRLREGLPLPSGWQEGSDPRRLRNPTGLPTKPGFGETAALSSVSVRALRGRGHADPPPATAFAALAAPSNPAHSRSGRGISTGHAHYQALGWPPRRKPAQGACVFFPGCSVLPSPHAGFLTWGCKVAGVSTEQLPPDFGVFALSSFPVFC